MLNEGAVVAKRLALGSLQNNVTVIVPEDMSAGDIAEELQSEEHRCGASGLADANGNHLQAAWR